MSLLQQPLHPLGCCVHLTVDCVSHIAGMECSGSEIWCVCTTDSTQGPAWVCPKVVSECKQAMIFTAIIPPPKVLQLHKVDQLHKISGSY